MGENFVIYFGGGGDVVYSVEIVDVFGGGWGGRYSCYIFMFVSYGIIYFKNLIINRYNFCFCY